MGAAWTLVQVVGADFAKEFKGLIVLSFPDPDTLAGSIAGCKVVHEVVFDQMTG